MFRCNTVVTLGSGFRVEGGPVSADRREVTSSVRRYLQKTVVLGFWRTLRRGIDKHDVAAIARQADVLCGIVANAANSGVDPFPQQTTVAGGPYEIDSPFI